MLSANGGEHRHCLEMNVESLHSVLNIAANQSLDKVFWPISVAVFRPTSAKYNTRQHARSESATVYGISKKTGEFWCNYYFEKYDSDVRSLWYPGLISYTAPPGGGTTDYAVDIYHQALEQESYSCFLEEDLCLPVMYMPDAIRAMLELMDASKEKISTVPLIIIWIEFCALRPSCCYKRAYSYPPSALRTRLSAIHCHRLAHQNR